MNSKTKGQFITSDALRSKALEFGSRDAVKVNQRMLIDKMLARYSSDFVFCRELIQNADDAGASSFQLELLCNGRSSDDSVTDRYHKSKITEIRTTNNGRVFQAVDWQRVASIAEGNTNVESVGQFGVGFFSVFALSDEPIIVSGKEYMVFIWQNTDSLTTCRYQLPVEQQGDSTSIIMKMRGTYVLNTQTSLSDEKSEISLKATQRDHRGRFATSNITPTLYLAKLKAYFTKGNSYEGLVSSIIFVLLLFE
jgi:hypothetical protein